MTAEALEAWVLHKRPSGDTSAWVTFFTREKGIFDCLCKGGRTPKKQAMLQPFLPLWLAVDFRSDCHYARHIETVARPFELKGNSLFAGLYVNELLYYALSPLDSHSELFDVYRHTIESLTAITDRFAIELVLRRFEWSLLSGCGYSISFTKEARTSTPIEANRYYQLIVDEGFIAVEYGIAGREILALDQGLLDDLAVLKTAKLIMRQAIAHLLGGRELKSRSYARSFALMEKMKVEK